MKTTTYKISTVLLLAVILFFSSCEPKRLGEETFDLNGFPFGLSVSRFYETELKKEHTKTYYSSCDTSFKDDSGNKKVEVITYLVDAEKPAKPLAKLKNVSFNVIKSIADAEDNLMMISGNAHCGFKDQMKLLGELKKEHGQPVVIQHIYGFTTFTWRKSDRTVQIHCEMIPNQNNYYNKKGEYLNPFGGFLKTDNYEPNHRPQMFFYIFNPEAIETLNNHSGLTSSMSGFKPYFYDYTKDTKEPY